MVDGGGSVMMGGDGAGGRGLETVGRGSFTGCGCSSMGAGRGGDGGKGSEG